MDNNEFEYNQGVQNNAQTSDTSSAPSGVNTASPYTSPYSGISGQTGTQNSSAGTNQQNVYGQQNNYQQSTPYGQANSYGQQSAYGASGSYGQTNTYSQSGGYQNAYDQSQMGQSAPKMKKQKPRREKKPNGFGAKLGRCAAVALVFGLVAGGVFTGVSYAGVKALGIGQSVSTSDEASNGSSSDAADSGASASQTSANVAQTATGEAKDLQNVSAIVEEAMPSIVAITNTSTVTYQSFFGGYQQYESESRGSGIVISQDSDYLYIATNNHVVSGAETLSVQFSNDTTVSGEIQGTYAAKDLAVVKVALKDIDSDTLASIRQITIGDSDTLKVGEGTIAIGNALGYGQSVTTGIVSALDRTITVQDESTGTTTTCDGLIQTDAAINPGNSGGALLNAQGELIGINSAKYSDTSVEGIGYAIPITDAMKIINALIAGETLEKTQTAYLGIGGTDVSSDVASAYSIPQGVYVKAVYEGTGAADAGICQGDIITAIDGTDITGMSELQSALADYSAGDTVTLTVWRMNNGYQSLELQVTLSEKSALENTQDSSSSDNEGSESNDGSGNNGNFGNDGNSGNNGSFGGNGNSGNSGNNGSNGQSQENEGNSYGFPFGW